jgi:hypothetical protein
MQSIQKVFLFLSFAVGTCLATGQGQPPVASSPNAQVDLAALVKQQFGPTFTVASKFPTVLITADFDGDGVEDAVIVANSNEPFPDSFAFKYTVSDPYDAYFGMGNPATASQFSTDDPSRKHVLLIIFGTGSEAWRSATPKDKFVIVNLPFDDIAVGRILVKKNKPPLFAIKTHEAQIMDSAVYWDAKKKRWKWEPGGSAGAL